MGQRIIAENAHIASVTYKLPNKFELWCDMLVIALCLVKARYVLQFRESFQL